MNYADFIARAILQEGAPRVSHTEIGDNGQVIHFYERSTPDECAERAKALWQAWSDTVCPEAKKR